MRQFRARLGAGAVAALILAFVSSWFPAPAEAQTAGVPDAHYCELFSPAPYNFAPGVVYASGQVRCWTDASRRILGQAQSIGIRVELYFDRFGNGQGELAAAPQDSPTSVPTTDRLVGLTLPNQQAGGDVFCENGLYYAKVTGSVVFKSGTPRQASVTVRTPSARLTCSPRLDLPPVGFPPIEIPPSDPTPFPPADPPYTCTGPRCLNPR